MRLRKIELKRDYPMKKKQEN